MSVAGPTANTACQSGVSERSVWRTNGLRQGIQAVHWSAISTSGVWSEGSESGCEAKARNRVKDFALFRLHSLWLCMCVCVCESLSTSRDLLLHIFLSLLSFIDLLI